MFEKIPGDRRNNDRDDLKTVFSALLVVAKLAKIPPKKFIKEFCKKGFITYLNETVDAMVLLAEEQNKKKKPVTKRKK